MRIFFFFSSRRRHTRWPRDWSSDVCSSDLLVALVQPIVARVVEDHVEDDAQAGRMRAADEVYEIGARTESWIDVEKILDGVTVIAVVGSALLEDRAEPDRADPQLLQVRNLRCNPF